MPISLEMLPEPLRPRVGPDAPERMRLAIAKALLPMGPGDLFASLAYLVSNETGELQETARKSLTDMPRNVVETVLKESDAAELLDFALREYIEEEGIVQVVVLNGTTPDRAVEWAARRVNARIVELIGNNQERIVRHSPLVEAIYYNPEAPMAVVSRVFETGVRNGLDLHHIPGFKEIYTSIFGEAAGRKVEELEREARGELPPEVTAAIVAELPEGLPVLEDEGSLEDDDFMAALRQATREEEEDAATGTDDDRGSNKKPLHSLVKEMSVPQKVRLALVGNKTARGLLIKDSKAVVALSVLKSPQITDGEIADFAKNKALSDRVIAAIARNSRWVKNVKVQFALIKHPKAPPAMTNRWVRALNTRNLKDLSKSRDVPGHVSRLAKNILQQRQQSKKG